MLGIVAQDLCGPVGAELISGWVGPFIEAVGEEHDDITAAQWSGFSDGIFEIGHNPQGYAGYFQLIDLSSVGLIKQQKKEVAGLLLKPLLLSFLRTPHYQERTVGDASVMPVSILVNLSLQENTVR